MLDEHISWNDHMKTVESKLAKNIGLLNCTSYFLNELSLKNNLFFLYSLIFELFKYCMG